MAYNVEPKPIFQERMNSLLKDEEDRKVFWEVLKHPPQNVIRCNTIKITPDELKKRLKNWDIAQPFKENPEIMIIKNDLLPGELGKTREHILGYYYVQELVSMLPIIALSPNENESLLDCCASPGSKTTQAAAMMNNKGVLIANDNNLKRMFILSANLERCGVSDVLLTNKESQNLSKLFYQQGFRFDKILVDAPCSGEGTIRSSRKNMLMWNHKIINVFAKKQKVIAEHAIKLLKIGGEMVYSTCTHAPEENEAVVNYLLSKFDLEVVQLNLELKTRPGLTVWQDEEFDEQVKKAVRIYPQDNNTEGFFLCKLKKLSDNEKNQNDK